MTTQTHIAASLRALLDGVVDYAGLFPPAGLPMQQAVENYAKYAQGEHKWMLGRFVLPVTRFKEFEDSLWEQEDEPADWDFKLSVLIGEDWAKDAEAIEYFVERSASTVDCAEIKLGDPARLDADLSVLPKIPLYFEVPAKEIERFAPKLKEHNVRAKIRTGGLNQQAFPSAEEIAHFIEVCTAHRVPFKATAGLHHPLRCVKPFTYEPESAKGTMHGFLNVFLAAALTWAGTSKSDIVTLLAEEDASAFRFDDEGAHWRERSITTGEILQARAHGIASFGSCSFEEPVEDLKNLQLL